MCFWLLFFFQTWGPAGGGHGQVLSGRDGSGHQRLTPDGLPSQVSLFDFSASQVLLSLTKNYVESLFCVSCFICLYLSTVKELLCPFLFYLCVCFGHNLA